MNSQLKFNNLKSYDDFKLNILSIIIDYPTPKLNKISVPFQNGEYDFTEINGDIAYSNRKVTVEFEFSERIGLTRTKLNSCYSNITMWLFGAGDNKLYIDYESGYLKGRVVSITPIEIVNQTGKITVEFDCYPFKVSELHEGNDIWDTFNFELDILQDVKFDIRGTESIRLYNNGAITINPIIICSEDIEVIKEDITYKFKAGETRSWSFKLNKGENNLVLKGNGTIEFKWFKEVL